MASSSNDTQSPVATVRRVPTLRRTWITIAASFVAMMLVLGVLVVGATQYQHSRFSTTTTNLEQEMAAVVTLERVLREVDGPAAGMMYGLGGEEAYGGYVEAFERDKARVAEAFDEVAAAVHTDAERDMLARARASWQEMTADVEAAPGMHARNEVYPVLEAGDDPFAEAWEHLTATHETLGELRSLFVADLRANMAATERVQRMILPTMVGAIVLSLLLAGLMARTLRRRVVAPLMRLRATALSMREATPDELVDPAEEYGVAELADLAGTLRETARSLRTSHDRLRDQANTDGLTGLANRKAFVEALAAQLSRPGGRVAALFVDLDDFKIVNDTMGHAAGDELLRVVAQRLQSVTREDALLARLGGDEFAIVLDDLDESGAVTVAERVLAALGQPATIDGRLVEIACSIGVAVGRTGDTEAEELVHSADQAMYTAKQHGKNRIEVFSHSLYAEMQARTELRRDLGTAVAQDEFELHHQPIVDLQSGRLVGFEALIRWQHPSRGQLAPGQFIPLAEETGDIVDVGAWVLDRACRDLQEDLTRGLPGSQAWVSVNVSAKQLDDASLVDVVLDALDRHQLAPERLVLEVTEAVAVTSTERAAATLQQLRERGVTVALDDFGMGFSSLRYLADLPIDVIKIDRSFVTSQDLKTRAALNAIVTLGNRLGLGLIAEGIETLADLESLRSMGTMAGQGFLFARPMPVEDAAAFVSGVEGGLALHALRPALEA